MVDQKALREFWIVWLFVQLCLLLLYLHQTAECYVK